MKDDEKEVANSSEKKTRVTSVMKGYKRPIYIEIYRLTDWFTDGG